MGNLLRDLRFGLHGLLQRPGFTLAAVLILGLGIGATTLVFSILDGVVLRGLPLPHADRLMAVVSDLPTRGGESPGIFAHDFLDWRDEVTSFEGLAGFTARTVNLSGDARPERVEGAYMTPDTFRLLGIRPLLGRALEAVDAGAGAEPVVLLGHRLWQSRYSADPAIVGRAVRINSEPHTVVGVMPAGFRFPVREDLWLPLRVEDVTARSERGEERVLAFALLREGVDPGTAQAEMAQLARRAAEAYPASNDGVGVRVHRYDHEFVRRQTRGLVYTMFAAVGFVFLIACSNVASFLLARAADRSRELAIRTALGARRARLNAQLLTENALLAAGGALLGLVLAWRGVVFFNGLVGGLGWAYWIDIRLDGAAVLFVLAATAAATLVAGLPPALYASRTDVNRVIKEQTGSTASRGLDRMIRTILTLEVALSCALLIAGGLMIRTVLNLSAIEFPFAHEQTLTARFGLFETLYPDAAERARFVGELLRRLEAAPGVEAAAAATNLPADPTAPRRPYLVEGGDGTAERPDGFARVVGVTPGFFATFGSRILDGRDFDARDGSDTPRVVIVNQGLARRSWPEADPLGRRLRLDPARADAPWLRVVGVVPDLHVAGPDFPDAPGIYLPYPQSDRRFLSLAVVGRDAPADLAPALRENAEALDPDLPLYWVRPMAEVLEQSFFVRRLTGGLFVGFGAASLALTVIGIWAATGFSVSRRMPEVALRKALGADRSDVVRLVVRHGLRQLVVGLAVGVVLAAGLAQLLRGVLFGVSPFDPLTFAVILAVLLGAGLLACLGPARRALRADPTTVLRAG